MRAGEIPAARRRCERGTLRRSTCALVLLLAVVAASSACSRGGGDGDATERPARPAVCRVVSTAHRAILRPDHQTFVDLLGQHPSADNQGAPAALLFSRGTADLGPYEPAIDYLIDRYRAWDPAFGDRREPELTATVRASARRLDHDLAAGLCR